MIQLLPIDCALFNKKHPTQFWLVFDRFSKVIFSYARSIVKDEEEAEEIKYKVFLRIWDGPDKTFEKEQHILSYLYSATRNLCIDHLRRAGKLSILYNEGVMTEQAYDPDDLGIMRADIMRVFYPVIQRMPSQRRQVIIMFLKSIPKKEIAEVLKISVRTVSNHIQLAREDLKKKAGSAALRELMQYLALIVFSMIWKMFKNKLNMDW
jgi:RNA polymerase sigma factor (sigma-70 family)